MRWTVGLVLALAGGFVTSASRTATGEEPKLPLLLAEDFENGADRWQPSDPKAWKIVKSDKGSVFSQFEKRSKFDPPHRSPYNFALLKDVQVGDFVLTARVRSTVSDYGHRDVCLFFGYQDPAHFYYVHFGKKTDDRANQIFVVNSKDRAKISTKTSSGTDWTDNWHTLKLVRKVESGTVEVYFDDMNTPVMLATDKTFAAGRVGIGSFDDTSEWDDVKLYGVAVTK